ncbi:MAG TPA: phosphoribosylglycinamide formyltransferase [Chitinophagaceae bacterium]
MKKIAIFASGAGSNAKVIIEKASGYEIALIVTNKSNAGVLAIASDNNIPSLVIDKEKFFDGNGYVDELRANNIDLIVLAGFLWKIPGTLIAAFPDRIINIHPALLPNYGGKGMYGHHVHQAVLDNKEKESGITIHYVDGHYDNGDIIFQARCPIMEHDTADSLAKRVQALEHAFYPKVVAEIVDKLTS